MTNPGIIVLSTDDEQTFRWMSDGWNQLKVRHTTKAQQLFTKAKRCIEDGTDVRDVIDRLEKAGFKVTRDPKVADSAHPGGEAVVTIIPSRSNGAESCAKWQHDRSEDEIDAIPGEPVRCPWCHDRLASGYHESDCPVRPHLERLYEADLGASNDR
jgi:hypothetical protein